MIRSKISGVGMYVPPKVVKNDDLRAYMDTSDEWIRQRTGVEERRWADISSCTSDMALIASRDALKAAKTDAKDIDMIILGTLSGDHDFPGTACYLQQKLNLPGIPALDVRQQCTGFIYGLSIADQFIRTGFCKKILVVGAEHHSKGLDLTTRGREVSVLFGDGAGAVVVEATTPNNPEKDPHIISTHLHADGAYADELALPGPGSAFKAKTRFPEKSTDHEVYYPVMNGKSVFTHAIKRMPEALLEALHANKKEIKDVDLFLFHQANLRINDMVTKQLEIPEHKVFNTIQKYGNTTAATIPIGMVEAMKAGALKPGMLVASAAFGSGFTWASALIRW